MAKRGRRERACGPVPLAAGGRYDAALCVVLVVLLFGCGVVAPAGGDDASILRYVNAARAEARRCDERSFARAAPVAWNTRLAAAARRHAEDMALNGFLDHEGTDESTAPTRARDAGYDYRAVGENLAVGIANPREVVDAWLGSPGHCANLMSNVFDEAGAAQVGSYWVVVFGARASTAALGRKASPATGSPRSGR